MRVICYLDGHQQPWSVPWIHAFTEGARRHDQDISVRSSADVGECDLAVIWGHRKPWIQDTQKAAGRHYVVLERGYVGNRREWTSVGLDGLNGHADFVNEESPPERWERHHGSLMSAWKYDRGYVLLAGQVWGDATVAHYPSLAVEYQRIVDHLVDLGREVVWRPHPRSHTNWKPENTIPGRPQLPLGADLDGACALACLSSNSGVEAVLAGVPVIALDDLSMAWDVSSHTLDSVVLPARPDRSQWAASLAYTQWNLDEFSRGDVWEHLSKRFDEWSIN